MMDRDKAEQTAAEQDRDALNPAEREVLDRLMKQNPERTLPEALRALKDAEADLSAERIRRLYYRNILIAGYAFSLLIWLSSIPIDWYIGKEAGDSVADVLSYLLIALIWTLPYGSIVICWSIWRSIRYVVIASDYEKWCLIGAWIFFSMSYLELVYLWFDTRSVVEAHWTRRAITPFIAAMGSPILVAMGSAVGFLLYKVTASSKYFNDTLRIIILVAVLYGIARMPL